MNARYLGRETPSPVGEAARTGESSGHATRMPSARRALTPVAVSSGDRSEFGEGSLEPLNAHGEALLQRWSHLLQYWLLMTND
jgi:hypothetical protein